MSSGPNTWRPSGHPAPAGPYGGMGDRYWPRTVCTQLQTALPL